MFRICASIRFQLPWVNTKQWRCYKDTGNTMLIFIKTATLSTKLVVPICIPISSLWKLLLHHDLKAFDTVFCQMCQCSEFLYCQCFLLSNRHVLVFQFAFCWWHVMQNIFSCLFVTCTSSLMRYFLRIPAVWYLIVEF